ncbi:hypothetical protein LOTGIDRAFT_154041 [Lottia gigantea]|uniref:Endonuclease/exonuclease/phosphatase domain-containing protein n=1 Tax=Lottia gigantea TaxID=225164 RepID=V3ZD01_LOTGI|nr:hypothetical protein LOTGIDRAFT_154041 [Lottia gigantea]ESO88973.1 hypothetical protein LOTGIDRAFT_154041 [Lottia gigantea]
MPYSTYILPVQRGKTFVCGNLNARCSTDPDYISCDNLSEYVNQIESDNDPSSPPLPRNTSDKNSNSFGSKLLSFCKSTSCLIANGRLGLDASDGRITFCNKKGESLIDYLLVPRHSLHDVIDNVYGKTISKNKNKCNYAIQNKWFSKDCRKSKNDFKKYRNEYYRGRSHIARINYVNARNKYNGVIRNAKSEYQILQADELCNLSNSEPKSFWKRIKASRNGISIDSSLSINDFVSHFHEVYGEYPKDDSSNEFTYSTEELPNISELDKDFTIVEVVNALSSETSEKLGFR